MFFTLKFYNCTRCVEPIEHLKKCTRCVEPFQVSDYAGILDHSNSYPEHYLPQQFDYINTLRTAILPVSAPIAAPLCLFDRQCPESSLSKMVIAGECVDDPHILHDDERDAIGHPHSLSL